MNQVCSRFPVKYPFICVPIFTLSTYWLDYEQFHSFYSGHYCRCHQIFNSLLKPHSCCIDREDKLTDWLASCTVLLCPFALCPHYPHFFLGVCVFLIVLLMSQIHPEGIKSTAASWVILVHAAWIPCCVCGSDLSAWLCAHWWGWGLQKGILQLRFLYFIMSCLNALDVCPLCFLKFGKFD